MKPTEYTLLNLADGHNFPDASGWTLADPAATSASLVRACYKERNFLPDPEMEGIYRYHRWMPIKRTLEGSCAPVTLRSEALAKRLGLNNLYLVFSGWWPEKGAFFKTCSFKETEAYSVCGRLAADEKRSLVVSSAGNTARAFAHVCSRNNIPLVISIPYDNLDALWFDAPLNPCVKVIATPSGSDYFDAIALGDSLCGNSAYFAEGGAKNIARRDGMGTTLLSFVEACGRIPDFYFQAVGSGTGAIAAWENNLRLIEDGSFGKHKMKLVLSQNSPFTLMYDSWKLRQRKLVDISAEQARSASAEIDAKVLSNRKPPYSLCGGLYDALTDTDGEMLSVSNDELAQWKREFLNLEGIDIHNAAAVALASLFKAVEERIVRPDESVMLNITGGGEQRRRSELEAGSGVFRPENVTVLPADTPTEDIVAALSRL